VVDGRTFEIDGTSLIFTLSSSFSSASEVSMTTGIGQIRKRDGRIVEFNPSKITNAILKAFAATKSGDGDVAKKLTEEVVEIIKKKFEGRIPSVENVQDVVEEVLIKRGYANVAKAYILYRQRRAEVRATKALLGVTDDLKLTVNAVRVLQRRYLLRDERGEIIETPSQMFRRVAKAVAAADRLYDEHADIDKTEEEFYQMMAKLEFLPNSPTLMNAGTPIGQLSACFVLPIDDSIVGIFDALKAMALIHHSGEEPASHFPGSGQQETSSDQRKALQAVPSHS
jgi:ribonucleoside-diphosphate reductase alpha chain